MLRTLWTLVVGLAPPSRLKNWLLRRAGHDVARSARVMPSVFFHVDRFVIGERAKIGPGNVFRYLRLVQMEADSVIGQWNWLTSHPHLINAELQELSGVVRLGASSSLTSRHYVDAAGGFTIGEYTAVGGVRSTFITHHLDIELDRVRISPCHIGSHSLVGSNLVMIPGASIPNRCQVAMGALVTSGLLDEGCIYGGTPARKLKDVPHAPYFERTYTRAVPEWSVAPETLEAR